MTDNLAIWNRFADIDPKFTKPITGKQYSGTSPNPHYVIRCLTELFGPVGEGFGWDVVHDEFCDLGGQTMHFCRIKFWHTDRAYTFDACGGTPAAYVTSKGKQMVDEDAPKKSLTDAITKAAAQIGVGANIFLGRWDDSKYVAGVNDQYRDKETPVPQQVAELKAKMLKSIKEAHVSADVIRRDANYQADIKRLGGMDAEAAEEVKGALDNKDTQQQKAVQ